MAKKITKRKVKSKKSKVTKITPNQRRVQVFLGVVIITLAILVYLVFQRKSITYRGVGPCADCPGINTTLTLYDNQKYKIKYNYLERNTSYTSEGSWAVIETAKLNGAIGYRLTEADGKTKSYFLLKGDRLIPLDNDLKEMPSPYNAPLIKQ